MILRVCNTNTRNLTSRTQTELNQRRGCHVWVLIPSPVRRHLKQTLYCITAFTVSFFCFLLLCILRIKLFIGYITSFKIATRNWQQKAVTKRFDTQELVCRSSLSGWNVRWPRCMLPRVSHGDYPDGTVDRQTDGRQTIRHKH